MQVWKKIGFWGFFCALTSSCIQAAPEISLSSQAQAGKRHYDRYCIDCHLAGLRGSGHGPALSGPGFTDKWDPLTTSELFQLIKTSMPPGGGADLGEAEYLDLVAYILQGNGRLKDAGPIDLQLSRYIGSGDSAATPAWQSFDSPDTIDVSSERVSGFVNRAATAFTPVTPDDLAHPPAGDWLSWRRYRSGIDFAASEK